MRIKRILSFFDISISYFLIKFIFKFCILYRAFTRVLCCHCLEHNHGNATINKRTHMSNSDDVKNYKFFRRFNFFRSQSVKSRYVCKTQITSIIVNNVKVKLPKAYYLSNNLFYSFNSIHGVFSTT